MLTSLTKKEVPFATLLLPPLFAVVDTSSISVVTLDVYMFVRCVYVRDIGEA